MTGGSVAGADALVDEVVTVSVPPATVVAPSGDDEVEVVVDEDEATGPAPSSSFATTGAALPVAAPVPTIAAGALPG